MLIYRESTYIRFFYNAIFLLVQYCLWSNIYKSNTSLPIEFSQFWTYLLLSQSITSIYPSDIGTKFSETITDGSISLTLLKPKSAGFILFFENIGITLYRLLFIATPLIVISIFSTHYRLHNVIAGLLVFAFAYILMSLFELVIGCYTFLTNAYWGIQSLKSALIIICAGKLIPFSFYPPVIRDVLNVLPFKYMYNLPINVIMGADQLTGLDVIVLLVFVALFYILFKICYNQGILKLSVQGG
jgi:ABC-2 type transport system permease protein